MNTLGLSFVVVTGISDNRNPTKFIHVYDIVFISQVKKFQRLSGFLRLYISHTIPKLRLNCGCRL